LKLVTIKPLIDVGGFTETPAWRRIASDVKEAIDAVRWPPGSENFTIHPQSGKSVAKAMA